jgi:thioredoxin reductase
LPDIEGHDECWAHGIFHCLYCHGYEERGGPSAGVLTIEAVADAQQAVHYAHQALQLDPSITIYTNANPSLAASISPLIPSSHNIRVDDRPITKFTKASTQTHSQDGKASQVNIHFASGPPALESFIAHRPIGVVNGPFCRPTRV